MRAPVNPERMPERDRPAEGVELLVGDLKPMLAGHDLPGEGLVDLDHVDVVDLHARPLQLRTDRGDGPEANDLGAHRGDRQGQDPRLRLESQPPRLLV